MASGCSGSVCPIGSTVPQPVVQMATPSYPAQVVTSKPEVQGTVPIPQALAPFIVSSGPVGVDMGDFGDNGWISGGKLTRKKLVPHPLRWASHSRPNKGMVRLRKL